ncbi:hypothetical protein [Bacillus pretiosus]|uniref:Uncharacterized protein n=1 Tax=Bacillus pretiosus TaxID=2983392 RepID=A0ABT3F0D1_9BACI|nr:hypothetical protein [Bacillus pretiosus]MCW1241955.1 hypothetical protein [Bacillus pretiosus]
MRAFEKETLDEIESLYEWADRRAHGEEGKRRLSKQHTQYVLTEFRKLAKRYIETKEAVANVENGRKTIK